MQTIHSIHQQLKKILMPVAVPDYGCNGIQVENSGEIQKIGFAVDACEETIQLAVQNKCNLLIVHHGLFWGHELPITGTHYRRLKLLLDNNIGLLAYHLPLDGHPELGNNAQILKHLGAKKIQPCGFYKGFAIGYSGELQQPLSPEEIATRLAVPENSLKIFNFHSQPITRIGVLSGSGGHHFQEFAEAGVELFLTGDQDHTLYHTAQETRITLMFCGHYYTEIWGVQALQRYLSENCGFLGETEFFSVPTGL